MTDTPPYCCTHPLPARCLDQYFEQRVKLVEHKEEVAVDERLVAVVERMIDRCCEQVGHPDGVMQGQTMQQMPLRWWECGTWPAQQVYQMIPILAISSTVVDDATQHQQPQQSSSSRSSSSSSSSSSGAAKGHVHSKWQQQQQVGIEASGIARVRASVFVVEVQPRSSE